MNDTPEPRNQMAGSSVTATEKRLIQLVATVEEKSESDVIREALAPVFERGREMADLIGALKSANSPPAA